MVVFAMSDQLNFEPNVYENGEWSQYWHTLEPWIPKLVDGMLLFKNDRELFCERKKVIPKICLQKTLKWCHDVNGHPGVERTIMFFSRMFFSQMPKKALVEEAKKIVTTCEVCLRSKPNNAPDRGLISALPIPQVANDLIYIDFVSMDPYNQHNYVLTIVDALTKFVKFIPCTKNISGEDTLKLILKEWIVHYDKPTTIFSDNDVRFSHNQGFYQKVFRSMGIQTKFSIPRHPQSNGLCERTNRAFLQNMRILTMEMRTMDWPKLCPIVTWMVNSQINPQTILQVSYFWVGPLGNWK